MTINLEAIAALRGFASALLLRECIFLSRFRLHLIVESITLHLNLNELCMNIIAHKLLDNIFLMLKLVLRLASLFSFLLLLD